MTWAGRRFNRVPASSDHVFWGNNIIRRCLPELEVCPRRSLCGTRPCQFDYCKSLLHCTRTWSDSACLRPGRPVSDSIYSHIPLTRSSTTAEIARVGGHVRRSRSSKVTDFGTTRKPVYGFLHVLVNNTNSHPVSHRLTHIAECW